MRITNKIRIINKIIDTIYHGIIQKFAHKLKRYSLKTLDRLLSGHLVFFQFSQN